MTRPSIQPAQRWHFPDARVTALDNGMQVWSYDIPGQHVAALDLVMPSSLALEPRHLEGVATVALHAVDEGTIPNPDGRIQDLLELQGAGLNGAVLAAGSRLGADAPVSRLPRTLELFAEIVTRPAYAESDVAHHIEQQVAAFESRLASPGAVAKQAFRTALHGEQHRAGRPSAGTPDTLAAITRDDVLAYHDRRWSPDGAVLVLAGDLRGQDIVTLTAPLLDWCGQPAEAAPIEPGQPGGRIILVDMPDAVQATIQAGCLTVGRHHPDWASLKLAGHAMAGGFASRLNLELRERRAFTYGIGGGFAARRTDGEFLVGGSFRVDVAAEAAAHIVEALRLEDPFSETEIADARQYLIGIAPLANETADDIAKQAAALAMAGESPGFVNDHFAALELPGASDATRAFREQVRPDGLVMAVSGPVSVLEPAFRAAGLDPVVV